MDDMAFSLKDDIEKVREAAVLALGSFGESAASFAPDIADLLTDEEEDVCIAALKSLKFVGSDAAPFAPEIS